MALVIVSCARLLISHNLPRLITPGRHIFPSSSHLLQFPARAQAPEHRRRHHPLRRAFCIDSVWIDRSMYSNNKEGEIPREESTRTYYGQDLIIDTTLYCTVYLGPSGRPFSRHKCDQPWFLPSVACPIRSEISMPPPPDRFATYLCFKAPRHPGNQAIRHQGTKALARLHN
jgi:hypothetical protein